MTNITHINRGILKLICDKINNQCWCKSLQHQGLDGIANSQQLKSLHPSDYLRGHNILLHENGRSMREKHTKIYLNWKLPR